MRKHIDIASRMTFGDNMQNKNDGVSGSPPMGYKPNPNAPQEHVETVYREMAKRLTPADWQAIRNVCPELPDDILEPRSGEDE